MKYPTGEDVCLGDKVKAWQGNYGKVVCCFADQVFGESFPAAAWQHLKNGILVDTEKAGLIHIEEFDEDFEFISRA